MKTAFLTALFCVTSLTGFAATPSAEQVLSDAKATAASENKAIFVRFSASWCPWCKRLEAWLERPEIKPVFEKYFVSVKLVIREKGEDKKLENTGADEVLRRWGGESAGIPFSVFLDRKGDLIASSMRLMGNGRSVNIAYPNEPEAVDWFAVMMKKAAPRMAKDDLKLLEASLRTPKK